MAESDNDEKKEIIYGGFLFVLIFVIGILVWWVNHMTDDENKVTYEKTGVIGDTIGGLTAPIIGLISAFLVYIAFQEQLRANDIQRQALQDEKKRNKENKWFQQHQSIFDEVKKSLENLHAVEYGHYSDGTYSGDVHLNGLNALGYGIKKLRSRDILPSIYYNVVYILTNLIELIARLDGDIREHEDAIFLKSNIRIFYMTVLNDYIKDYITLMTRVDKKETLERLHNGIISKLK